jgi:hypothetical protein
MDQFTMIMWCAIGGIMIAGVYFMWKSRRMSAYQTVVAENDPPIEMIHVPREPSLDEKQNMQVRGIPQPSHTSFENSNPYGLMKPCRFGEVTQEKRVYITNNGLRAMHVNPQGMPLDRRYVASKLEPKRFENPPVDITQGIRFPTLEIGSTS